MDLNLLPMDLYPNQLISNINPICTITWSAPSDSVISLPKGIHILIFNYLLLGFPLPAFLFPGRWAPHGFVPPLQVLNLTRQCIQRHRDFVVPLLLKYSEEWQSLGYPIFRPAWWLSPTDPVAFTIEDEFLIGDEVGILCYSCKSSSAHVRTRDWIWADLNPSQSSRVMMWVWGFSFLERLGFPLLFRALEPSISFGSEMI